MSVSNDASDKVFDDEEKDEASLRFHHCQMYVNFSITGVSIKFLNVY